MEHSTMLFLSHLHDVPKTDCVYKCSVMLWLCVCVCARAWNRPVHKLQFQNSYLTWSLLVSLLALRPLFFFFVRSFSSFPFFPADNANIFSVQKCCTSNWNSWQSYVYVRNVMYNGWLVRLSCVALCCSDCSLCSSIRNRDEVQSLLGFVQPCSQYRTEAYFFSPFVFFSLHSFLCRFSARFLH